MQNSLSPTMLPIAKYQKDILDLIDQSSAVVISGKTGCGKSTQVPQYILRRHPDAKVVVCQPRRVAATSLAVRVSEELNCKLGKRVGYHIGMESFKEEHCSIVYMTYGILIQQLLFKDNINYTHIVLDEIHERSLEMDFTFVALKNMINQKYKQKIKLIVMSATLNAELFCNYFSTNHEGNFYLCQLKQAKSIQQQSRRGRSRGQGTQEKENFELIAAGKQFKPALRLQLQQQKLFKIEEYYLDDLKQKQFYYGQEEQRIPQEMYNIAIDIIKKTKAEGDYLIFLPGLFQIRTLKGLLINSEFSPDQIIEVHSLFSDQLYHHLFNPNIKNKLILATNIGESSITLPFCRVVIDFCLSRKNYSKDRGVTRLQTRLASQANLIQRSGRVGRVSDGKVYRLITKQLYQQLSQYQKPEIQCVSLEMIILRVKQLDFNNKNQVFRNPYYFLMSTINPPQIHQIRKSLEILIQEQAILGQTQHSVNVRSAQQLYLTQMGKFMVQMPCELRISKMVLMGLKVRIPMKIISIACILMLSKQFFLHEERRYNIEEFMHSLVGYDRGYFNDYLLRENLFSHWREEFYEKAKEKKLFKKKRFISKEETPKIEHFHRIYQTEQGAQEVLNFLQEFNQEKWSEKQKDWCSVRGVSPNVMRELIRLQQNLRLKIISKNFKLPQKQKTYNELILLCLQYGFPDNDCDVKWAQLSQQIQMDSSQCLYYIDLPNIKETNDELIQQYVRPEKDYKIEVLNSRTKRVYGNTSVLSKFLLPRHYSKGQTKNCSPLYEYLSKSNINHHFATQFSLRSRPITILNESICKSSLPNEEKKNYKLITHKFTEIGNKRLVGMGALVEEETFLMIQLILRKDIELILHPSQEYFCGFRVNGVIYNISTILDQHLMNDVLFFRDLISQKKQTKLDTLDQMMKLQDIKILNQLLKAGQNQRVQREIWQFKYQIELHGQFKDTFYHIEKLPKLKPRSDYHQKYINWKLNKYKQFYNQYRPLFMDNIYIICKKCTHQLVQIQLLSFYKHQESILKLNQYSGSWKITQKSRILTCRNGHEVGKVISQEEAKLAKSTVMLYIPYNHIEELWPTQTWKSEEEIAQIVALGKQELQRAKEKLEYSQCIFCFEYEGGEGTPKIFDKQQLGKNYLKKYMDHMRNQQHLNNIVKFRSNLNLCP